MNHRARTVRENYYKTSTILAVAAIAAVLSSTVAIGSEHIALAYNNKFTRDFSNSGNNQEIQQDCGNSCTETSSNTISSGSSGLTTPSPSPTPTSLILFAAALTPNACLAQGNVLCGHLDTNTYSPVAGANITFTGFNVDQGKTIPIWEGVRTFPMDVATNNAGYYQVQLSGQEVAELMSSFNTITAHYAGSAAFGASDSNTLTTNELSPPP